MRLADPTIMKCFVSINPPSTDPSRLAFCFSEANEQQKSAKK
jgi:hypothetical protein